MKSKHKTLSATYAVATWNIRMTGKEREQSISYLLCKPMHVSICGKQLSKVSALTKPLDRQISLNKASLM